MPDISEIRPKTTVVIPVGPEEQHAKWLHECLLSVAAQTHPPFEVIFVDDMHDLFIGLSEREAIGAHHIYRPPWLLGVAHAFNAGSAVAFQRGADLALMLGADDLIQPRVIESVEATWEQHGRADGFYYCEVHYFSDDPDPEVQKKLPPDQSTACNCAAWTPGLFRMTGGFSVESASGACDAAFISQLMIHHPEALAMQVPGQPDAWFMHRAHPDQQTWHQPPGLVEIRDWLTNTYKDTEWGRYE